MDARESLRRMRNFKNGVIENFDKPIEKKKNLTIRDTLKITRNFKVINESDMEPIDLDQDGEKESKLIDTSIDSRKTILDQEAEEEKFRNAIKGFNVDVQFLPIEILDNSVVFIS